MVTGNFCFFGFAGMVKDFSLEFRMQVDRWWDHTMQCIAWSARPHPPQFETSGWRYLLRTQGQKPDSRCPTIAKGVALGNANWPR